MDSSFKHHKDIKINMIEIGGSEKNAKKIKDHRKWVHGIIIILDGTDDSFKRALDEVEYSERIKKVFGRQYEIPVHFIVNKQENALAKSKIRRCDTEINAEISVAKDTISNANGPFEIDESATAFVVESLILNIDSNRQRQKDMLCFRSGLKV